MGCLARARRVTCPAKDHCCGEGTFHVFKAVQELLSHADLHSSGVGNQDGWPGMQGTAGCLRRQTG